MTILDEHDLAGWPIASPRRVRAGDQQFRLRDSRLVSTRPAIAPMRYRGTGLAVSAASHRTEPLRTVSTPVTVALAGLAALITVWLSLLAQAGGGHVTSVPQPAEQLAVVYVQDGETLESLAGRVAPDSPVDRFVDRIRDLNELSSPTVVAGQSLIAPIS